MIESTASSKQVDNQKIEKEKTPQDYKNKLLKEIKGKVSQEEINKIKEFQPKNPEVWKIVENLPNSTYEIKNFLGIIKTTDKFYSKILEDSSELGQDLKSKKGIAGFISGLEYLYLSYFQNENLASYTGLNEYINHRYDIFSLFFKKGDNIREIQYDYYIFSSDKNIAQKVSDTIGETGDIRHRLQLASKIYDIMLVTGKQNDIDLFNKQKKLTNKEIEKLKNTSTDPLRGVSNNTLQKFFKNTKNISELIEKAYQLTVSPNTQEKKFLILGIIEVSLNEKKFKNFKEELDKDEKLVKLLNANDIQLIDIYLDIEGTDAEQIKQRQQILSGLLMKFSPQDAYYISQKLIQSNIINGKDLGIKENPSPKDILQIVFKKVENVTTLFMNIKKIPEKLIDKFTDSIKKKEFIKEGEEKRFTEKMKIFFSPQNLAIFKQKLTKSKDPLALLQKELKKNFGKFLTDKAKQNPTELIIEFTNFIFNNYKHKEKQKPSIITEINKKIKEALIKKTNLSIIQIGFLASLYSQSILQATKAFFKTHPNATSVSLEKLLENNSISKYIYQNIKNIFYSTQKEKNKLYSSTSKENKDTANKDSNYWNKDIGEYIGNKEESVLKDINITIHKEEVSNSTNNTSLKHEYIDFKNKYSSTNLTYEQYIQFKKQIEQEKGLIQATGAVTTEITKSDSLLFKNIENLNSLTIKHLKIDGVHIIEAYIPGKDKILQIKSLNLKDANKELVSNILKENFNLHISFDNWSGDDFNKLINSDITKEALNQSDFSKIKSFFQIYFYKLWQNNEIPKDFFSQYDLQPEDIIKNTEKFANSFSEWSKNKLQFGGFKAIGTSFYLDPFDKTIKETISDISTPGKMEKLKNEIVTKPQKEPNSLFEKFTNFLKNPFKKETYT